MDILEGRGELKKMSQGSLFTLLANQRLSKCEVGAKVCAFLLQYQNSHYCVSELTGNGCPVERSEQSEQLCPENVENNGYLPIFERMQADLLSARKYPLQFKVYHRDDLTRSIVYLGTVIERRRKERGNNFNDLLNKAVREYSGRVQNSSQIFLMGN